MTSRQELVKIFVSPKFREITPEGSTDLKHYPKYPQAIETHSSKKRSDINNFHARCSVTLWGVEKLSTLIDICVEFKSTDEEGIKNRAMK